MRDSGGDSLPIGNSTPLRYRGRNSSMSQTNERLRLRKSKRGRIPGRYLQVEEKIFSCTLLETNEPTSFQKAIDSSNHKELIDAIRDEMDSMKRNKVWKLADLPPRHKSIGNKWVFKIKRQADESINNFDACLVAKGFTHIEGADYEETFSPVVRIASIRLFLSLVAHLNIELFQMDVKTTFLTRSIEEEIYMD